MLNPYQPLTRPPIDADLLRGFCKTVRFHDGDVMRQRGLHYKDMYWIVEGCVDVDMGDGDLAGKPLVRFAGSPVGEIGFLRGQPATATVTARDNTVALAIDDAVMARIESDNPALYARLLQVLGDFADRRTSESLTMHPDMVTRGGDDIDVLLCRTRDMAESAQRLRYDVYCRELGRDSPHADHARGLIVDALDDTAITFIAVEGSDVIGTLRANISTEGPLGAIEDIYGMKASPEHPEATAVCTKFIVKKAKRRGPAAVKLIGAMTRFGVRRDIRECYIDCIPALLPYYKAMGFRVCAPAFFHRENGVSHPMCVDLMRHGTRLSGEFGMLQYVSLYLKAKAIRLIDGWRGGETSEPQRGAA